MGLRTRLRQWRPAIVKDQLARFLARRAGRLLAPVIKHMADTGLGTDACLEQKCLPMPVHFYSPVPDLADLDTRQVWDQQSEMPGVAFDVPAQLDLLAQLGRAYGDECRWPVRTDSPGEFFTDNGCFSYGCAAVTHCMIRHQRPRKVIEIGSGNSSLVIAKALQLNNHDGGAAAEYTVIDPYPRPEIETFLQPRAHLTKKPVEQTESQLFEQLGEGDILFIDSSHVVRIGGDVNFLYLDIVPRLTPGITIHSHDIPLPYEYSRVYYKNPAFRVMWTESYLLQALLTHSTRFESLLGMCYLMANHRSDFGAAFRHYNQQQHTLDSGSFWFRSVAHASRQAA